MRLFVPEAPPPGLVFTLPEGASRHAQVRRVQPGHALVLFDGSGAEWPAEVTAVRRDAVLVRAGEPAWPAREAGVAVTLAVVVPANERMDWLVEKATELGAAALVPLQAERSVLRLAGERADKRRAHWAEIVRAASEQCGRVRLMAVAPVQPLAAWLASLPAPEAEPPPGGPPSRWLLGFADDARPAGALPRPPAITTLSGPEGGLAPAEEAAARAAGFVPVSLGPRVLRAETAPLAALALATAGG